MQKWRNSSLERYLGKLAAMGDRVRLDVLHVLFSKSGFAGRVTAWAQPGRARLLTPVELLGPFASLA